MMINSLFIHIEQYEKDEELFKQLSNFLFTFQTKT